MSRLTFNLDDRMLAGSLRFNDQAGFPDLKRIREADCRSPQGLRFSGCDAPEK
ncbi:hypothetical protein [Holdemania filiformis]|uniref:hypothetical protein n=1 Tax=Holdemania filiformis TaxID=61171 RepID=UPI00248F429D|nr:hypothetical protein [Holdemania filiformis]